MTARVLRLFSGIEWVTLVLIAVTYASWGWSTTSLATMSLPTSILLLTLALVLHASLTHEVIHGHPTPWTNLNGALMRPAVGLVVPYGRFRDMHLAHHHDENLTDPYDDPESNFMDPAIWTRLPAPLRFVLRVNNTLLGRLILGPAISNSVFITNDLENICKGCRAVRNSWLAHGLALIPIGIWLVYVGSIPIWAYLIACYASMSVLRLRTFLEHRAHARARARTVVIEDRGVFSFLFLNNNFHVVHHMHPRVAWYKLPAQYYANKAHYLRRNDGYLYRSYWEVARAYLFQAKDPVPHPEWPQVAPMTLSASPLSTLDTIGKPQPIARQPIVKTKE
ncbi:MAG: fatty acid desaturase [Dinoroseobacter sp.]|nr:fatty acid desaturase [Dinoroseobacter sp.]